MPFIETPSLDRDSVPARAHDPDYKVSVDGAMAKVKAAIPDLQVTHVELPEDAYAALTVQGTRAWSPFRHSANTVHVNPYTEELISARSVRDLTPVHFTSALLVPLHFGDFGGLVSKTIWIIFGCLLSAMVCSGFMVWSRRAVLATKHLGARPCRVVDGKPWTLRISTNGERPVSPSVNTTIWHNLGSDPSLHNLGSDPRNCLIFICFRREQPCFQPLKW